jgi:hypothetical protein
MTVYIEGQVAKRGYVLEWGKAMYQLQECIVDHLGESKKAVD